MALPLVFGAMLAQSLPAHGLPALYPFIQEEFNLTHAQLGLITSAFGVGFTVFVALSGWLTDSLGVKRVAVTAMLGLGAFTVAFMLASAWPLIIALSVLSGIASSPIYPATTRAIMEWFPQRIRAIAMSLKQASVPVSGALAAGVLPLMAATIGWRAATAASGVIVLLIGIVFALRYRNAPKKQALSHRPKGALLKAILRDRRLMTAIGWGAVMVGIQYCLLSYFMLFLMEELGFSAIAAGGVLALAQVVSVASRILWGVVSDFLFHGRRVTVLAITGFVTVLWLAAASLMGPGTSNVIVIIVAAVIGATLLSYQGVHMTLMGELSHPDQIATTVGIGSTANHISAVVAPPLFGLLVDLTRSYSLAWLASAFMVLAITVILITLGREPRGPATSAAGHP